MSNSTAIAAVTEGLKALLQLSLEAEGDVGVPGAVPTSVRPQAIDPTARGVNVFLYQVTPNAAWRNMDLPTRRDGGDLVRRPQLALDLHYLLTFTGDEPTLEAQRIMGAALAGLHARPVLTSDVLADLVAAAAAGSYLKHLDLAAQVESVRFTLAGMNLEELSKLWSVFFQVQYQLSTAVVASVVLLEAPLTPSLPLPVRERGIHSAAVRTPSLTRARPEVASRSTNGDQTTLTLFGRDLLGTRVRFGSTASVPADSVDAAEVALSLPDELRAGVHLVRVARRQVFGEGASARDLDVESNAVPFMLVPTVLGGPFVVAAGGELTVPLDPLVGRAQEVRVVLGGCAVVWSPPGGDASPDFAAITVRLPPEVEAGEWPLRVEVDGASSVPGTASSSSVRVT